MFDIGFLELLFIAIVGLLVLGPERLPGAIRTVTLWIGRLRRSFNSIKQDIEREVGADEIRRQLHNEAILDTFKETGEVLEKDLKEAQEKLAQLDYDVADVIKGDHSPAATREKATQHGTGASPINPDPEQIAETLPETGTAANRESKS